MTHQVRHQYEAPPQLIMYHDSLILISKDIKWTFRARLIWWCLGWKYIPGHIVDKNGKHLRDLFYTSDGAPKYSDVVKVMS